ncbi:hypothetical protein Vadar_003740 [Vaccinium darrowii]|uniref:Uncharacterized protein n=1 Tax=Vaccinium darrowii TaxID=229202 RepID=A0ACB7XWL0_9ERIC|nr:hypothetical protein Vadar_003740 [Vaccinium darrowii]
MAANRFQRSTSTISMPFKLMCRAICNLAPHIIRPPDFHDCVGAIDGTQIEAWVLRNRQAASRWRKSTITQHVMAVCSFDMKFTYVYPGWEGSAHDGCVFNKYYVVDAGYTNMPGYLAPYLGRRYRRDKFNGANTVFRTPMELFNHEHSSLRNAIEQCFGVLKGRFPILKHMPNYPEARQPGIVRACCVIHNFILMTRGIDEFFEGFTNPFDWAGGNDNQGNAGNMVGVEPINMSPQNK